MIAHVDLNKGKVVFEEIENPGAVTLGVSLLLESIKSIGKDLQVWKHPVYIGKGPFSSYEFMGANRAVATFLSPLTGGVFVSSAGGVSLAFTAAGLDGIALHGRAEKPTVIVVNGGNGKTDVMVYSIDGAEDIIKNGVFEFIEFIDEELGQNMGSYYRIGAIGPGALGTNFGSLLFTEKRMGTFDLFGRGGLGSVLARKNVYALVVGGDNPLTYPIEGLKEALEGLDLAKATEKYRLVMKEGVGGTIYNWFTLRALLPALNWNTIYMSEKEREEIFEDYIKPLTEEIKKRFKEGKIRSKTCGERCIAVCKKMDSSKKVEYEPFTSLGLQTGIFDYNRILEITNFVDNLGLDAIETGNAISVYIDAIDAGREEGNASLVDIDPERNYEFALDFLNRLVRGEIPLSDGVAKGSREMGLRDLAVYVPTRRGGIVPPQYWNPGFHMDLPLIGKFMTHYHNESADGKEWGKMAGERFMKELLMEDMGICRFHRKWAEKALERLLKDRKIFLKETVHTIKLLNIVFRGYVMPPEGRASDLITTYYKLFKKEVDPWKWYFEAKEGIDEVVPTLEEIKNVVDAG